jgi:hypothetical protein
VERKRPGSLARSSAARLGALMQADLAGGGDREFRRRKNTVGDEQEQEDNDLDADVRH